MAKQVRLLNSCCLATGFRDLTKRLESVIEKQGCYIEGTQEGKSLHFNIFVFIRKVSIFTG